MYKKAFIFSIILGIVWGLTVVYIAIEHNPQMAVYSSKEGYDIIYLAKLFISWVVPVAFVVFAVLWLFICLRKFLNVKK